MKKEKSWKGSLVSGTWIPINEGSADSIALSAADKIFACPSTSLFPMGIGEQSYFWETDYY